MRLSPEAQRWEHEKAALFVIRSLILSRAALVEQLCAYAPLRGRGDSSNSLARCKGKTGQYTDRGEAEKVADKLTRRDPDTPLFVYGCPECGGFHLTTSGRQ